MNFPTHKACIFSKVLIASIKIIYVMMFLLCLTPIKILSDSQVHVQDCVSEIMKHARQSNIPMVVDGVCNSENKFIFFQNVHTCYDQ